MSTLGLPDLQYQFHGMDRSSVINHAYKVASYVFDNDNPIKDGDVVDGILEGEISRDI